MNKPFDIEAYCDGLAKADTEHAHQRAFIGWCLKMSQQGIYKLAHKIYAIPNGGKRDAVTAARLKAEGVRAGIPDLHYPVSRGGCLTLYIEMKTTGGSLSAAQLAEHVELQELGHRVVTCWSWRAAREAFIDYELGLSHKAQYK